MNKLRYRKPPAVGVGVLLAYLFSFTCLPILPTIARAACPPGSQFLFDDRIRRNVRVPAQLRDQSTSEGSFQGVTTLSLGEINATISPSASGINTQFSFNIRQRLWRLRVPRSSNLDINDLVTSYSIQDANGNIGVVSASSDASSRVDIQISENRITRRVRRNRIVFQGYIDIEGDFRHATRSGRYSGRILTTVDCN